MSNPTAEEIQREFSALFRRIPKPLRADFETAAIRFQKAHETDSRAVWFAEWRRFVDHWNIVAMKAERSVKLETGWMVPAPWPAGA